MTINQHKRYTVESVVTELEKLIREDIPQEYKNWAKAGIIFTHKYPDANIQDYPNNIFGYIQAKPMPSVVRDLVEGILNQGVEEGSGIAAYNLAELYYTEKITEESIERAKELYDMAAESDDEEAVEKMGFCYFYGRHCRHDYKKAFECFSKGAFTGRAASLYMIADMYRNGYYLLQDKTEAFRIYSRCIDLINKDRERAPAYDADVYVRFADCLLHGTGCEKDPLAALYWAQRAEYEFRRRESRNESCARDGIIWAMNLISECRFILDDGNHAVKIC